MKPRPSPPLIPSLVRKQIEARSYSPLKINFRLGSVQFAKNNPRNDRARSKAISRVHHHEFSFLDQNESSRDSIIFQPAFVTTFPPPELINSPLRFLIRVRKIASSLYPDQRFHVARIFPRIPDTFHAFLTCMNTNDVSKGCITI